MKINRGRAIYESGLKWRAYGILNGTALVQSDESGLLWCSTDALMGRARTKKKQGQESDSSAPPLSPCFSLLSWYISVSYTHLTLPTNREV